jgi:hypothetical protein
MPREIENDFAIQKSGGFNSDHRSKQKQDISIKIEKALRAIEEKLEVPDNNIVEESVQRSIFGIFARNFKLYKETTGGDMDVIFRKFFKGSHILDETQRIILYMNLPYSIIKERIEPVRIMNSNN